MAETKPQGIKRNDPDPRPVEGATNRVAVQGQDPDKHYVYVSMAADPTMNPETYRSIGYNFTQYDPDGPIPTYGYNPDRKQGDKVESFGMVLMECSKEHKARLDQQGAPGAGGGQQWADQVQAKIRQRDMLDETEPMTAVERAKMRGITTGKRYGGDSRSQWEF